MGGMSESCTQLVTFIKDKCSCMLVCYCMLIHLYLLWYITFLVLHMHIGCYSINIGYFVSEM
jgi:hypothetical protein